MTGRVLAADTGQPIANVKVKRVNPTANQNYDDPAKGGQKLESAGGVRTDRQGRFILDAERALTLFQQQIWFSVTVSGKSSHSSMRGNSFRAGGDGASVGVNAIDKGVLIFNALRQLEDEWGLTKQHPLFPPGHFT
ncbi:MAG: hypothetical protein NT167_16590, partial [Verrucomicrobia bacterium]|nr:hypothetical protein [Verrucomicrobiota bacterium]